MTLVHGLERKFRHTESRVNPGLQRTNGVPDVGDSF
jgi:hypothetical protein